MRVFELAAEARHGDRNFGETLVIYLNHLVTEVSRHFLFVEDVETRRMKLLRCFDQIFEL